MSKKMRNSIWCGCLFLLLSFFYEPSSEGQALPYSPFVSSETIFNSPLLFPFGIFPQFSSPENFITSTFPLYSIAALRGQNINPAPLLLLPFITGNLQARYGTTINDNLLPITLGEVLPLYHIASILTGGFFPRPSSLLDPSFLPASYYYPAGGFYSTASYLPSYRINDTGITLADSYSGGWISTVLSGASGEIKLKEVVQFETDFYADMKFKSHPVASSAGSVIGKIEGSVVTFTVYFDNGCIGTFVGSGTSAYISGTYSISCYNGAFLDEGTFDIAAE